MESTETELSLRDVLTYAPLLSTSDVYTFMSSVADTTFRHFGGSSYLIVWQPADL